MDSTLRSWLEYHNQKLVALCDSSDLVDVEFLDPQHHLLTLRCNGLVRDDGEIRSHDLFRVGVFIDDGHLRAVDPGRLLTWFEPLNVVHPNVRPPFACIGPVARGTTPVEVCHRLVELVTYQSVTVDERDALDFAACAWARQNMHLFPTDERPTSWRSSV